MAEIVWRTSLFLATAIRVNLPIYIYQAHVHTPIIVHTAHIHHVAWQKTTPNEISTAYIHFVQFSRSQFISSLFRGFTT